MLLPRQASLVANSTDGMIITGKPLSKNSSTTQSPLGKIYILMSKFTLASVTVAVSMCLFVIGFNVFLDGLVNRKKVTFGMMMSGRAGEVVPRNTQS